MNILEALEVHNDYMRAMDQCKYVVIARKNDFVVKYQRNGVWYPLTYVMSKEYAHAVIETLYWLSGHKELKPHRGALKYIQRWIPRLCNPIGKSNGL
jgi:hypothetical protein